MTVEPKVTSTSEPVSQINADLLVFSYQLEGPLGPRLSALDSATGGLVTTLIEGGSLKGRFGELEWIFPAPLGASRVLILGAGKAEEYDGRLFRRLVSIGARQARAKACRRVCFLLDPPEGMDAAEVAAIAADGVVSGLWDSDLYKERKGRATLDEVYLWADEPEEAVAQAIERGTKITREINFARWLGDEPANVMFPARAAEEIAQRAQALGVAYRVLDEDEIADEQMDLLLSVAQGSHRPPRVVLLDYRGAGEAGGPTLAFVGKGVTFDTGGISIKPAADMHWMKYDMCGAAAAVAGVFAAASLQLPINLLGVVGLVENMPGGQATRPGDVVRGASGKTVEIINTDAEGRLVLADLLYYARAQGAGKLVDLATLTGGIKVALGTVASGVMGKPAAWVNDVVSAAEVAGERIWPMPLFPEYLDLLKSNIADMMNSGGRWGSALTAGIFLQQFVGDTPWAHLDIAGTAYLEKDAAWQTKGATGAMIRTLVALAEAQAGRS